MPIACEECQSIPGTHKKHCSKAYRKDPKMCKCQWVSNSGRGGEPVFNANPVSDKPVMHVKCLFCGARTWLTEQQWKESNHA